MGYSSYGDWHNPSSAFYLQEQLDVETARAPEPVVIPEEIISRESCSQIRGTEYTSVQERDWYRANCQKDSPIVSETRQVVPLFRNIVNSNSHLERIKDCESGGDYTIPSDAKDANGVSLYWGAYQFDLQTWASVGGTGNPIYASPEEQDMRAQILYEQRGSAPWPVCQYR